MQMGILRIEMIEIGRQKWQDQQTREEEERGALVMLMLCTSGLIALEDIESKASRGNVLVGGTGPRI